MATATANEATRPQRLAALDQANRVRLARACWKRRLCLVDRPVARRLVADLLEDPPEVLRGMALEDLLGAANGIGPGAVRDYCGVADVDPVKTVGSCTPRQRALIMGALRMRRASEAVSS